MTWWSGLPIVMDQPSYIGWNNRFSSSYHSREVVLLNVQRCDSSKVFLSDNQYNSDAAFSQKRVGLGKVNPKNSHLTLSHGFPSPMVRSQQVWS
ncbi:unnamed protein product [Schistosoma mattheei]|uniref:Uncharacterized protein n=1 Tax=Schistosoma mattheei TaxID=31246 RepID=A0A3P8ELW5_9TREM|nr:unnamed protein product [Schistosoma mattheei]